MPDDTPAAEQLGAAQPAVGNTEAHFSQKQTEITHTEVRGTVRTILTQMFPSGSWPEPCPRRANLLAVLVNWGRGVRVPARKHERSHIFSVRGVWDGWGRKLRQPLPLSRDWECCVRSRCLWLRKIHSTTLRQMMSPPQTQISRTLETAFRGWMRLQPQHHTHYLPSRRLAPPAQRQHLISGLVTARVTQLLTTLPSSANGYSVMEIVHKRDSITRRGHVQTRDKVDSCIRCTALGTLNAPPAALHVALNFSKLAHVRLSHHSLVTPPHPIFFTNPKKPALTFWHTQTHERVLSMDGPDKRDCQASCADLISFGMLLQRLSEDLPWLETARASTAGRDQESTDSPCELKKQSIHAPPAQDSTRIGSTIET